MDQQKAERESMSPPASPHCNYVYLVIQLGTVKYIDTEFLEHDKLYQKGYLIIITI